jgi:rod shape determining protein RodA
MIQRFLARLVAHLDGPLMGLLALLLLISTAVVFSASGENTERVISHLSNIGVALAALLLISHLPPQRLMQFAVPAYILGLFLLLGVAAFGVVVNGSRRWLELGITRIQPSELMRLAAPMMLAWYFHYKQETLRGRDFIVAALMLVLPVGLIAKQPDLGTSLLITASGFYVLFLAGLSWKVILGAGVVAGSTLPLASQHRLHLRRVLGGIRPDRQPVPALALRRHHLARPVAGGQRAFPVRAPAGRRHRAHLLHLRLRQHGHGVGHPAGGGGAAAPGQLRRHLHAHRASGFRHCNERRDTQKACKNIADTR